MNYYLDTEFHEYAKKPLFGKPINTIELISIGIVSEDGREYYAVSKDFDVNLAWDNEWLRENVLFPIYKEHVGGDMRNLMLFTKRWMNHLICNIGKSKTQIAEEVKEFVNHDIKDITYKFTRADSWDEMFYPKEFEYIKANNTHIPTYRYSSGQNGDKLNLLYNQPKFYAYYADYDWVVFCWLFGRMIDLPKGFPMYCIDLKQELDKRAALIPYGYDVELGLTSMKLSDDYPKQENEHNALSDAKWNQKLHQFLLKF